MTTTTSPIAERIRAFPYPDSQVFAIERPSDDAAVLEVTRNGCGWLYVHDHDRTTAVPAMILVLPSELRALRDFLNATVQDA